MNYKRPYFSIVTPFFNGSKFFKKFIKKLKSQTYNNWECILVDDYSNDNGFEKIQIFINDDNRIKVYKNPWEKIVNSPYQARNFGISKAVGEYICFLDIDDYWLDNMLMIKYKILKNSPETDILFSNYIQRFNGKKFKKVSPLKILPIDLQLRIHNPLGMLTCTVKRGVILNHKFKATNHEDYLFWAELQKNKPNLKTQHINKVLAVYAITENSISSNKFLFLKWHYKCYLKLGYKPIIALITLIPLFILKSIIFVKKSFSKIDSI